MRGCWSSAKAKHFLCFKDSSYWYHFWATPLFIFGAFSISTTHLGLFWCHFQGVWLLGWFTGIYSISHREYMIRCPDRDRIRTGHRQAPQAQLSGRITHGACKGFFPSFTICHGLVKRTCSLTFTWHANRQQPCGCQWCPVPTEALLCTSQQGRVSGPDPQGYLGA